MMLTKLTPKGRPGVAKPLGQAEPLQHHLSIDGTRWTRVVLETDEGYRLALERAEVEALIDYAAKISG